MSLMEAIGASMGPVGMGKKVPFVMASLTEHGQRIAGVNSRLMYDDVDVNTEIACLTAEYFNDYPSFSWDVYNFEARALGQNVVYGEYGLPDIDTRTHLITSEADLDKIKWPTENPLDSGRYPLWLKQIEVANRYFPYQPSVFPAVSSFTLACFLCGFPEFMRMTKKNPDLAHEIMRRIVDDIHAPLVKAVAERVPSAHFLLADAWEMIPNVSPKFQKEFVWLYYDRLREKTEGVTNGPVAWYMTYGEGFMPDKKAYLQAKIPYNFSIQCTHTEDCPDSIYHELALETGLPFNVYIPAVVIQSSTKEEIIEYVRKVAKEMRPGVDKFTWIGMCPAAASSQQLKAVQAAGQAFSALPCPTAEEFDKIQVEVPEFEETFEEFCHRKARENTEGYTFNWLDQATFPKH